MANELTDLVTRAIALSRCNPMLREITLSQTWCNHGPSSTAGSWIETTVGEIEFENMLCQLDWTEIESVENGKILSAQLPEGVKGYMAAADAANVDQDAIVEIDVDTRHPSAVMTGTPSQTSTITLLIVMNAIDNEITHFSGITGPVVITWFPGDNMPRNNPDDTLKTGDKVTVAEARIHGFNTVKFSH